MQNKAIAVAWGDEMANLVSRKVYESLFSHLPIEATDMCVSERNRTNDGCIAEFVENFKSLGTGVKISTASANAQGKKSANILLRELTGAMCNVRMTQAQGKYKNPCGIIRFLSGDFYSARNYRRTTSEDGLEIGVWDQFIVVEDFPRVAEIAADLASRHGLKLYLTSKWTIADPEEDFHMSIKTKLDELGASYTEKLADYLIAEIPHMLDGGFLVLAGNSNGDIATDSVNVADWGFSMGSTIYCRNGNILEELPGGTDPRQLALYEKGERTYHTPLPYVFAFARAYALVNPHLKEWCDHVMKVTRQLHENTPADERETFSMIEMISNEVAALTS